jgi:integrase
VQDDHGARQADYVLAIVRGIMNWYATRHDDYHAAHRPRHEAHRPEDPQAARILDDDELRAIWSAAEANGTFGAIIRLALLTAQRREKLATMRWDDVTIDGEWHIPVPRPVRRATPARWCCRRPPSTSSRPSRASPRTPTSSQGAGDGAFQRLLTVQAGIRQAAARRSSPGRSTTFAGRRESMMARAGVRPDIAERVMGHAIAGVEGVYDRHSYRDEKADALARLAGLLEGIVNPSPEGNVVPLREVAQ